MDVAPSGDRLCQVAHDISRRKVFTADWHEQRRVRGHAPRRHPGDAPGGPAGSSGHVSRHYTDERRRQLSGVAAVLSVRGRAAAIPVPASLGALRQYAGIEPSGSGVW